MSAETALSNCRIACPEGVRGVEIVAAGSALREFPAHVSSGLGICLKYGHAHDVVVAGSHLSYPAESVCVRAPGTLWASEPGFHAFLSIDLAPQLLPEDWSGSGMAFMPRSVMPDLERAGRRLLQPEDDLEAQETVTELLQVVFAQEIMSSDLASGDATAAAVSKARDFLHANVDGRPTLDAVSSASGVSKFALLREFRRAIGATPHAYLVMLRVSRAQELLAAGATPAEVARSAGFSDQAHLGRWFRRLLGVTPANYRRQVRTQTAISF